MENNNIHINKKRNLRDFLLISKFNIHLNMQKLSILLTTCILTFSFYGCHKNEGTARLNIRLTDAPGNYEEVNVDIKGIEIHANSGDLKSGWNSLNNFNPGVYNLLEFTAGVDTLLGSNELPVGKISQIRFVLGPDNSVKINGEKIRLITPSAQSSGLKLQVNTFLEEGITYNMLLDFDASRSIVRTGNGNYLLKPVIKMITEAESGAIKGQVSPIEASPAVYAIQGSDTLAGTFANDEGIFLLQGLKDGEYKVVFEPATGYEGLVMEGVEVKLGEVNNIGTVEITEGE